MFDKLGGRVILFNIFRKGKATIYYNIGKFVFENIGEILLLVQDHNTYFGS